MRILSAVGLAALLIACSSDDDAASGGGAQVYCWQEAAGGCGCGSVARANAVTSCSESSLGGQVACVSDGVGGEANSCFCSPIGCAKDSSGDCTCGSNPKGTSTSSCSGTQCCLSKGSCICIEGSSSRSLACPDGQFVSSCSVSDVDQGNVSSCDTQRFKAPSGGGGSGSSGSSECTSDSSCPGDCARCSSGRCERGYRGTFSGACIY